jgi:hypothetical protein
MKRGPDIVIAFPLMVTSISRSRILGFGTVVFLRDLLPLTLGSAPDHQIG